MNLKLRFFAGLAGVAAVLLIALALQSSGNRENPPPLTGWMEKFTPVEALKPAPALAFRDADGAALDAGKFDGRVVLVNFWATWCGPCVREMPSLLRLHRKLGGDAFTVIALSQDRKGFDVIKPFIAQHKLEALPVFHDPRARTALALKVRALPTSVLLDRRGRELGRLTGHAEWDTDEAVALIRYYLEQD